MGLSGNPPLLTSTDATFIPYTAKAMMMSFWVLWKQNEMDWKSLLAYIFISVSETAVLGWAPRSFPVILISHLKRNVYRLIVCKYEMEQNAPLISNAIKPSPGNGRGSKYPHYIQYNNSGTIQEYNHEQCDIPQKWFPFKVKLLRPSYHAWPETRLLTTLFKSRWIMHV